MKPGIVTYECASSIELSEVLESYDRSVSKNTLKLSYDPVGKIIQLTIGDQTVKLSPLMLFRAVKSILLLEGLDHD